MPTFAEAMVAQLQTLLRANVGGQTVSYAELERRHKSWQSRVTKESGRRPFLRSPRMPEGS